jgi:regulatory protein
VEEARSWLGRSGATLEPPTPPASAGVTRSAGRERDEPAAAPTSTGGSRASDTDGAPPLELVDEPLDDGARDTSRGRGRSRGRQRQAPPAGPGDLEADPEAVARSIVLGKLAVQARTRHELAKALAARDVPDEVADAVLDRMEDVGLVDDEAFARDWVQSRQQRRHLSRSALRRELQVKGVEREQIEEAVADVQGDDEVEAALALATKRFRSMQGLERDVQYRRLAGALARRGFGGAVTSQVLDQVLNTSFE